MIGGSKGASLKSRRKVSVGAPSRTGSLRREFSEEVDGLSIGRGLAAVNEARKACSGG